LYPVCIVMKLILFDIDGTLVLTGGAGMRAMDRAFAQLCGAERALEGIALAGRTDRVIVRDALDRLSPGATLDETWLEAFQDVYCRHLEVELANGASAGKRVLPGIRPLLDALAAREDVALGLLTGNFPRAARIKLAHFDLWDYFAWGAFGDAHLDRNALLPVAIQASRDHVTVEVPAERIVVIGDTPHDVACARSGGARCIAVATGIHAADELRATDADVVFDDLSDTEAVLRVLL
jgi:phosphoglycolate phosphatase-like HAD superfamily hydrolase